MKNLKEIIEKAKNETELTEEESVYITKYIRENLSKEEYDYQDLFPEEYENVMEMKVKETDIDLFGEFSDKECALALALMFDLTINDIADIEEYGDNRWEVDSTYYIAGNNSEMDDIWDEYLDNYIDECLEIPDSIRFYFDDEKWKDDAKMDGRGHALNSYDGGEESITLNGTDYYAYKN